MAKEGTQTPLNNTINRDFGSLRVPAQLDPEHHIAFLEKQRKNKGALRIPSPREYDRGGAPEVLIIGKTFLSFFSYTLLPIVPIALFLPLLRQVQNSKDKSDFRIRNRKRIRQDRRKERERRKRLEGKEGRPGAVLPEEIF